MKHLITIAIVFLLALAIPSLAQKTYSQEYYFRIVEVESRHLANSDSYKLHIEYYLPSDHTGNRTPFYYHATFYVYYLDQQGESLYPNWGRKTTLIITPSNSSGKIEILIENNHPLPQNTHIVKIHAGVYLMPGVAYGDEVDLAITNQSAQHSDRTSPSGTYIRILNVMGQAKIKPGEKFWVVVNYEFRLNKTQAWLRIFDIDQQTYLPTEPDGIFDVAGVGTSIVQVKLMAPPEERNMHLRAELYYLDKGAWVHDREGWFFGFTVEVKAVDAIKIETQPAGVVADDVSTIKVTVTLPSNTTDTIVLTDGVSQLKGIPVNGQIDFTYKPDLEKLGIKISQIPPEGYELKLTTFVEGTQNSASTSIKIYRRPVLLVHGTWSSSATWKKMAQWLRSDGFNVYTVDWPATESVMIVATNHLAKKIDQIRQDYLSKLNTNLTKIDIMAHSGGGLVSRYYIAMRHDPRLWPGHKPPKALYVHTLILVGTTNLGSPFAPIYMDAILNYPIRIRMLLMLIQALPGHFILKYGPLLEEQFPDSELLTLLNSMPNDPEVHYYTICGTKNILGGFLGRLIRFYGIHRYDRTLLERLTGPGDGIVDLHSQRYPEKFGRGTGYYVYASHTAETSNREVFIIASNLLKGTPDKVTIYKTPVAPKLTVRKISLPADESRFSIESDGGIFGTWKTLREGDELKPNEAIRITFNAQAPKSGEMAAVLLEVVKMGKIEGRILIRLRAPNIPRQTEIYVLAANALYVPPGAEVYVKYEGPVTIVTGTAAMVSPDPELTVAVDLQNRTEITLISGELRVVDLHNRTTTLAPGQKTTAYLDKPLDKPSQASNYDEWWKKLVTEEGLTITDSALTTSISKEGKPQDVTASFKKEQTVISWIAIANASKGDIITWIFQGPGGITEQLQAEIEWNGNGYAYAPLNLSGYGENAVGNWTITIYLNDKEALIQRFTVQETITSKDEVTEESSPLEILAGLFILILPIIAIIVIIHHMLKKKKSRPMPLPPPPPKTRT